MDVFLFSCLKVAFYFLKEKRNLNERRRFKSLKNKTNRVFSLFFFHFNKKIRVSFSYRPIITIYVLLPSLEKSGAKICLKLHISSPFRLNNAHM